SPEIGLYPFQQYVAIAIVYGGYGSFQTVELHFKILATYRYYAVVGGNRNPSVYIGSPKFVGDEIRELKLFISYDMSLRYQGGFVFGLGINVQEVFRILWVQFRQFDTYRSGFPWSQGNIG